jgi:hypothetical protein
MSINKKLDDVLNKHSKKIEDERKKIIEEINEIAGDKNISVEDKIDKTTNFILDDLNKMDISLDLLNVIKTTFFESPNGQPLKDVMHVKIYVRDYKTQHEKIEKIIKKWKIEGLEIKESDKIPLVVYNLFIYKNKT